ncbi:MAG TPA: KamA family radical SAM protein [Polyangiaceae bacterium]|nr:KamA family radical SAM protein [Polyangiaceae bacterium]
MSTDWNAEFNITTFREEATPLLTVIRHANHVETARTRLFDRVTRLQYDTFSHSEYKHLETVYVRDCVRTFRSILEARSDSLSGFSVTQALFDIARGSDRPDLSPAFFAELTHLFRGVQRKLPARLANDLKMNHAIEGREAAIARSDELDRLFQRASWLMDRYTSGLDPQSRQRRVERRDRVLDALGATLDDWNDYRWQISHVLRDPDDIGRCVTLTDEEKLSISRLRRQRLPFGITPFYLSLMDDEPFVRDRAIRAQVLPPLSYVDSMRKDHRASCGLDFMLERDTSPIDLVTRRYPGIVILKPFNTCPQICVYCQRNWEIDDAMMDNALAPSHKIDKAIAWIADHPAIHEVLVTGGDPLALDDDNLLNILERVAAIPTIERIRIGTRTPVTVPMRLTDRVLDRIAAFQEPGRRELCFVTHVEHPYELNADLIAAIERIRRRGMNVYNQNVFTFFVSRRFEAALLRRQLRLVGIDPYYTFNTKGKEETEAYRVPVARLLQEQHEEARLMPGLSRTDEAVFNVPRLGKNHLRARQHRDLISILPDGARVYEWHPWEKNIANQTTYVGRDVPVLEYLDRLANIGEDISLYSTIWYYF